MHGHMNVKKKMFLPMANLNDGQHKTHYSSAMSELGRHLEPI